VKKLEEALKELAWFKKQGSVMRLAAEEWDAEWKILIAIMLSARTRDEVTIVVGENLFEKFSTLSKLSRAPVEKIQEIVKPVNYYKTKGRHVKACAQLLLKRFTGEVPHDIDLLIELPGVGRKTANVFLSEMGNPAIGVDTHVARLSKKMGWTKNTDPHKIEMDLKKLFPEDKWKDINLFLVRFGKTYLGKKEDQQLSKMK